MTQRHLLRRVEEVLPSAARTVGSFRDVGYDIPQAIADLVDNSIAAGARHVAVDLHFEGEESWIRISDDGVGMSGVALSEALRYGSERDYRADDLGKFGFGLKTASTSQCRQVSVASRIAPRNARIEARCLDLGHIESSNRWEILVLDSTERPEVLVEPLREHPGTVVLWEDLDRVLDYRDPWGGWAQRRMLELAEELDVHLGMVFHRFLSGAVRDRELSITVNNAVVQPWDPFCTSEPATEKLPGVDVPLSGKGTVGLVRVQPYVLPSQSAFSSDAAWRRASGPQKWNRQQGFYIYRANRLIQAGGWSRMRTTDEHTKLARVGLDFFPELDAAFGINISKAIVTLPKELRDQVAPLVTMVTREAQARYRATPSGPVRAPSAGGQPRARRQGQGNAPGGAHRNGSHSEVPKLLRPALETAAEHVGEGEALIRIARALRQLHPEVADELGF